MKKVRLEYWPLNNRPWVVILEDETGITGMSEYSEEDRAHEAFEMVKAGKTRVTVETAEY